MANPHPAPRTAEARERSAREWARFDVLNALRCGLTWAEECQTCPSPHMAETARRAAKRFGLAVEQATMLPLEAYPAVDVEAPMERRRNPDPDPTLIFLAGALAGIGLLVLIRLIFSSEEHTHA